MDMKRKLNHKKTRHDGPTPEAPTLRRTYTPLKRRIHKDASETKCGAKANNPVESISLNKRTSRSGPVRPSDQSLKKETNSRHYDVPLWHTNLDAL